MRATTLGMARVVMALLASCGGDVVVDSPSGASGAQAGGGDAPQVCPDCDSFCAVVDCAAGTTCCAAAADGTCGCMDPARCCQR